MPRKKRRNKSPQFEQCYFCTQGAEIEFLDLTTLKPFLTPRGKIIPRQGTGLCARHQRRLAAAIKRARELALL